jgi:hypothetical protein
MSMKPALAVIAGMALGCSHPSDLLDLCDGSDDDGDGTIDEGIGTAIGCQDEQMCVEGRCRWVCGDGVCNPNEDCRCEDCGPCATCGDGMCNGAESCLSCEEDCRACEDLCQPCPPLSINVCGGPLPCMQRPCDGSWTCATRELVDTCGEVAGETCGGRAAWEECAVDEDCASRLRCSVQTGVTRCVLFPINGSEESCPSDIVCPPPPRFGDSRDDGLRVRCEAHFSEGPLTYDYYCVLRCTDFCPYDMICSDGVCTD